MSDAITTTQQLQEAPTVQKWAEGLRHHSGIEIGPDDQRLELLAGFCRHLGTTPDELVQRCFRIRKKDGMRAISSKNRTEISASIEEYVTSRGLTGYDRIKAANTLRSFLIHNGVLIVGAAFKGR